MVVHALSHQGVVYCAEIGHGIQGDFIHRAGGLVAVQHFSCKLDLADKAPQFSNRQSPNRDLATIQFVVQASQLRAGDVLVLGSVSGKNCGPIELALACRAKGVKTVGLTSTAYSKKVESLHSSGKKLGEVVDIAIDNGAPYGDDAVDIPSYRTGGLMLVNPIYPHGMNLGVTPLPLTSKLERIRRARHRIAGAFTGQSRRRPILASPLGRNAVTIGTALLARERNIKTIGITSLADTHGVGSRHHRGNNWQNCAIS